MGYDKFDPKKERRYRITPMKRIDVTDEEYEAIVKIQQEQDK